MFWPRLSTEVVGGIERVPSAGAAKVVGVSRHDYARVMKLRDGWWMMWFADEVWLCGFWLRDVRSRSTALAHYIYQFD